MKHEQKVLLSLKGNNINSIDHEGHGPHQLGHVVAVSEHGEGELLVLGVAAEDGHQQVIGGGVHLGQLDTLQSRNGWDMRIKPSFKRMIEENP